MLFDMHEKLFPVHLLLRIHRPVASPGGLLQKKKRGSRCSILTHTEIRGVVTNVNVKCEIVVISICRPFGR